MDISIVVGPLNWGDLHCPVEGCLERPRSGFRLVIKSDASKLMLPGGGTWTTQDVTPCTDHDSEVRKYYSGLGFIIDSEITSKYINDRISEDRRRRR